jgi:tetratricopeptide (TPR) repeat protein
LLLSVVGCVLLPQPPISESQAQLRVRRALHDLETAGFRLPGSFDVVWDDRTVLCAPGHVCISPEINAEGTGALVLAPRVLESDARLRLALLEVWQRLSDGLDLQGPQALARSTLRQVVSGRSVGVADPVLLGEVLQAYRGYWEKLPGYDRARLPDPVTYSSALGFFLVPVLLDELTPGVLESRPSLAPRALGPFSVGDCAEANGYVHPDFAGAEGRHAYWSGVCAAEHGETEAAIAHLLRAERWLPHDPRVPLELGEVLCRSGYREAGILAFERAATRSPTAPQRADAVRGIARCRLEAGDFKQARAAYRQVLTLDPEDVVTEEWLRWLEGRVIPRGEP